MPLLPMLICSTQHFYGVITENNTRYIPVNIQKKIKDFVDHTIEITSAYKNDDYVSFYMWGALIYVDSYGIIITD